MYHILGVAWLVMSMDWNVQLLDDFSFRPWRLLTIFYLLPGIVGTLMLCRLPESPKMLLSLGKNQEAFNVVNWIALKNSGKPLKEFKVDKLKSDIGIQRESAPCVSNSP